MVEENHYITGSHGFIGEHLCSVLKDVIRGDRTSIPKGKHIVDLASYGNLDSQKDIEEIYNANLVRVIKILREAKDYNSFILTSTSALQLKNQNHYMISKGLMEKIAVMYAANSPIAVFRPSTVIGVGEPEEHLIPRLIKSCLLGTEMNFVEKPVHDFISVDDVVSAIIFMEENINKCQGKIFNVSNNVGYSNKQIKEMVEEITGKKANLKIVYSLRGYDSEDWIVDNSELLKLGWKPIKDIKETICEMVSKEKSLI